MTQMKIGRVGWKDRHLVARARLREIAEVHGLKRCAAELGMTVPQLSNAFREEDRKLPAEVVWYLLEIDTTGRARDVVEQAAEVIGLEVCEPRPPSPEEELADLKEALSELLAPEMRTVVLQRAKRRSR